MVIEKNDLSALRLSEARGWFPTEGEIAAAGLNSDEYGERLRKLSAAGVIREFKTTLVVPPLRGGDWVWGVVLASAKRPEGAANALAARLPFVSEIVINSSLPQRIGPNLALLFYSSDFDSEAEFIRSAAGLEYHEVYRVAEYSFPVALPLSTDEKELLRFLVARPGSGIADVGGELGRSPTWARAKVDRLMWSEVNRTGVLRIQPEIDWSKVENFGHFHFLLDTAHRADQLEQLVGADGFSLVMGGKTYQNRYVQVEADVWGIGRLLDSVTFLEQIAGIGVAAVLWNREMLVNSRWVSSLL
jgi:hypothetical protein